MIQSRIGPLITVDMAKQALLKSLCYDPRGQDTVQQTKAGLPYYDGNPYDFEQWHFVVMGKYDAYASKKDVEMRTQDLIELSVKVIEGLKDDALKCATESRGLRRRSKLLGLANSRSQRKSSIVKVVRKTESWHVYREKAWLPTCHAAVDGIEV